MSPITYQETKIYNADDLEDLFLSVDWESGRYKDKLQKAIANYGSVFSAWDNDRLVGLIAAMDDQVMTAYVHYLCVNPAYQKRGIGKELVNLLKKHYEGYLKIALCAVNKEVPFYQHLDFVIDNNETAMCLSFFD